MPLLFNGSTQYVTAPTNSAYALTSGDTIGIELWIKPVAINSSTTFFARADGNTNNSTWTLRGSAAGGNLLEFVYYDGSGNQIYRCTTGALNLNAWNHVALYYTFATGSSMQYYTNFTLNSGSWALGTGNVAPAANSDAATIGARVGDGAFTQGFNGTMLEVRLFKNLSVPANGAAIQARAYKPIDAGTTGMIGYWRLDEGSGSTANDLTTTNNDGTLIASPTWNTDYPSGWNAFVGAMI